MEISKDLLLKQTIQKFKTFLVDDLKIDNEQLNSNEGLYEKMQDINKYKGLIQLIGYDNVTNYVANLKLQMFQDKVKKITIEQIRSKEKQVLEDLEKKNGIKNENLQEANDYLSNKFMNFFTARKISYLKYYKEKGEEKNEKDFLSSIKSQLIIVYQNNGKVVFSFMTFKEISEKLKLNKTINENNEYIKKNLNKIDVKKVLDIKEQEFN
ncbi:hypothetical protein ABPG74_005750 [Tetrahymena malaccensis]